MLPSKLSMVEPRGSPKNSEAAKGLPIVHRQITSAGTFSFLPLSLFSLSLFPCIVCICFAGTYPAGNIQSTRSFVG